MQVKHKLNLYIRSQSAEGVPPLGTVLGNLGVNTVNFCKEFNQYTADLPSYFKINVAIVIFTNRSYAFSVQMPSLGFCIRLLTYGKWVFIRVKGKRRKKFLNCIKFKNLVQLTLWKFPNLNLKESLPTVLGTLRGTDTKIVY